MVATCIEETEEQLYLGECEMSVAGTHLIDGYNNDHPHGCERHEETERLGPGRQLVRTERQRAEVNDVVDQYHLQAYNATVLILTVCTYTVVKFSNKLDKKRGYSCGQTNDAEFGKHTVIHEVKHIYRCPNCAVLHPPRQCIAYKDKCKYCDNIGHWAKCCSKKETDERQQKDRSQNSAGMPISQIRHRSGGTQDKQTSIPVHEISGYDTKNELRNTWINVRQVT